MNKDPRRVCPVEKAGALDNGLRRFLQDPVKILRPYIKEGMTVLDVGCGPGFFTIPMARLVGGSGRVIAVDLQEEMLNLLRGKIAGTDIEKRIVLHKCDKERIGLAEKVDFVLLFYIVHELPDQNSFFSEIGRMIEPSAQVLLVEPPFHVSKSDFEISLGKAKAAGLIESKGPQILLSKTAILQKRHPSSAA